MSVFFCALTVWATFYKGRTRTGDHSVGIEVTLIYDTFLFSISLKKGKKQ